VRQTSAWVEGVVSMVALQESCIGFVAVGAFLEGVAEGLGVAGEVQIECLRRRFHSKLLGMATCPVLHLVVRRSSPTYSLPSTPISLQWAWPWPCHGKALAAAAETP
jgi:hypothetical protein